MSKIEGKRVFQVGDIVSIPGRVDSVYENGDIHHFTVFDCSIGIDRGEEPDHGPVALIERPEPPAYFDGAKVGDEVWCTVEGEGVVERFTRCQSKTNNTVMVVRFARGVSAVFLMDGFSNVNHKTQSLFYATDPRVAQLKAILEQPC